VKPLGGRRTRSEASAFFATLAVLKNAIEMHKVKRFVRSGCDGLSALELLALLWFFSPGIWG